MSTAPRTTGKDLLLVGSVQLGSAEGVLSAAADALGDFVPCLPDGETGERALWVGHLAKNIYHGHPDIETLHELDFTRPPEVMGGGNKWSFRVRPGTTPNLELGYAEAAIESYAVFSRLKEQGAIPADVRFQVCFPSTNSAFASFFDDASDWPVMGEAYDAAVARDLQKILEEIAADELAIQFDVCTELRDMQGALMMSPDRSTKFEETIASVVRLSANVPEEALLGVHWCYGTLGGWPMVKIDSLDLCTRLTNAAIEAVPRPVDYVHMPVLLHVDESYFEPARELRLGGVTKVYLGLIHHTDGIEGFRQRMNLARGFMPEEFGVAGVCGYGRLGPEETLEALELHKKIGREMASGRVG